MQNIWKKFLLVLPHHPQSPPPIVNPSFSSKGFSRMGAERAERGREGRRLSFRCWEVHSYGEGSLVAGEPSLPPLTSPSAVLVEVAAASVNPIDVAMVRGYGAGTLQLLRTLHAPNPLTSLWRGRPRIEFPLTLGRDFSGRVVALGHAAKGPTHGLRVGDEVYGVVGVHAQGSHAQFVVAEADTVRRKPSNVSFLEAASIPYVALTSWAAINVTGAYCERGLVGKKFLVLGGSGGVGTFCIQYLKAKGAHVTSTCAPDAQDLLASLGADFSINYKDSQAGEMMRLNAPYDCILDFSGPPKDSIDSKNAQNDKLSLLKRGSGQLITLSPPFLSNMDKWGLVGGAVKNAGDLIASNLKSLGGGGNLVKWAFFIPYGPPLEEFTKLIEAQKIRPIIHQSFPFSETPEAYKAVERGHLRGKVVIDMQS